MTLEQRSEGGEGGSHVAILGPWDRAVQAEGIVSAKALRQDCAWHRGGTIRLKKIRAEGRSTDFKRPGRS